MKILAIDTSCDETSTAVTEGTQILSNIVWSQASQHAKFGGVMPALAQRLHEERIDWTINEALKRARVSKKDIGAIAVTAGPGLAIALGVGIAKAKEMAEGLKVPIIGVNHIEGHLLSPLAQPATSPPFPLKNFGEGEMKRVRWPALGLVISGGHTELILIKKIGEYQILAKTADDALGEALDKAARMLGLGYPGGAILEKMAREGNPKAYPLPLPMARQGENYWSYSGLKTAMFRLVQKTGIDLNKQQICYLAASFQNRAFQHLERVMVNTIEKNEPDSEILVGGGVAANMELRRRLRKLGRKTGLKIRFPYSVKLCGDNAGMIGVAAGWGTLKTGRTVDRRPRWRVDEV